MIAARITIGLLTTAVDRPGRRLCSCGRAEGGYGCANASVRHRCTAPVRDAGSTL